MKTERDTAILCVCVCVCVGVWVTVSGSTGKAALFISARSPLSAEGSNQPALLMS